MNAAMIEGNIYLALVYIRNAPIIWAIISSNAIDLGSRLATVADGIDSDNINYLELY
jgi:hypothetical protein